MTHRERVQTALSHQLPDRCPMQISFTPEFAARLRKELSIPDAATHNPHGGGNSYALERAIDEDMLLTSVGWANSYYLGDEYTDEWGIDWRTSGYTTPFGNGKYTEIVGHPLASDEAISGYIPPDPKRPELYAEAERLVRDYGGEYWIVGVAVTTIFETAWALRGLDRLMMDFALEPDLAQQILDIPFAYHRSAAIRLAEIGVDMIWTGDDMGSQNSMIISPRMWRQFFKPRMAQLFADLKRVNPAIKIAYHSDGVITPIIADLIEIGLDVLNPVQPACMDPAELKRRFGDRLAFWGTVDEQHTLPFGSADDVKAEIRSRLADVGFDGGLILGPTHHVQLDTPMENFWAMVSSICESSARRR
ncbi:MAG TPA: uroporphyrinogen decarboxylase family protein [Spirochaetia bacterium]|nr:uroporphyrinogen decarboxylase family protein [Spirochaetia bacterium]